jgi:hypothetical protein
MNPNNDPYEGHCFECQNGRLLKPAETCKKCGLTNMTTHEPPAQPMELELRDIIGYTCSRHWTTDNERRYALGCNECEYDKKRVKQITVFFQSRLTAQAEAHLDTLKRVENVAEALSDDDWQLLGARKRELEQQLKRVREGQP